MMKNKMISNERHCQYYWKEKNKRKRPFFVNVARHPPSKYEDL
jgi:hypothetical protein